jgi:hypothetical protein
MTVACLHDCGLRHLHRRRNESPADWSVARELAQGQVFMCPAESEVTVVQAHPIGV